MLIKRASLELGTWLTGLDNSQRIQRDVNCTTGWWKKRHGLGEPWDSLISDMPHLWVLNFTVKLSIVLTQVYQAYWLWKKSREWCFPRNIWGEGEHLYNCAGGDYWENIALILLILTSKALQCFLVPRNVLWGEVEMFYFKSWCCAIFICLFSCTIGS